MVDTSDEWIVTRSGIRERRIAEPDETVATMGQKPLNKHWKWQELRQMTLI